MAIPWSRDTARFALDWALSGVLCAAVKRSVHPELVESKVKRVESEEGFRAGGSQVGHTLGRDAQPPNVAFDWE